MTDTRHCQHGTFIGDPGGADYMCGWCEQGVSDRAYAYTIRRDAITRATNSRGMFVLGMIEEMPKYMEGKPFSSALATYLVDMGLTNEAVILAALDQLDAAQQAFDTWVRNNPTFDPDDDSEWGM